MKDTKIFLKKKFLNHKKGTEVSEFLVQSPDSSKNMLYFEHDGGAVVSLPLTSKILSICEGDIKVLEFEYKLNPQSWHNVKKITYKASDKGYKQIDKSGLFSPDELKNMGQVNNDFIAKHIKKIYFTSLQMGKEILSKDVQYRQGILTHFRLIKGVYMARFLRTTTSNIKIYELEPPPPLFKFKSGKELFPGNVIFYLDQHNSRGYASRTLSQFDNNFMQKFKSKEREVFFNLEDVNRYIHENKPYFTLKVIRNFLKDLENTKSTTPLHLRIERFKLIHKIKDI